MQQNITFICVSNIQMLACVILYIAFHLNDSLLHAPVKFNGSLLLFHSYTIILFRFMTLAICELKCQIGSMPV